MASFVKAVRSVPLAMKSAGYPEDWREAVGALLALVNDRVADYGSATLHLA